MTTQNSTNDRVSVTEVEIDFGSTEIEEQEFTITDSRITTNSKIAVVVSGNTPSDSRSIDEILAERYSLFAISGSGSFTLWAAPLEGTTNGKVKILYLLGV